MLKLLGEKNELGLVFHCKHVILRLKSLVEFIQTIHLSDQILTCREKRLLRLILLQSALVQIQLSIAGVAAILDEIKQWVQMVDLIQNFLRSRDPKLAQTWLILWRWLYCACRLYRLWCGLRTVFATVERCTCSVLGSLLESGGSISCARSLEAQEINALLPIEWLFHRIFNLLVIACWDRFTFFLVICRSWLIKRLLYSWDWILGFHELTNKEALFVLFHRLESCCHDLFEVRFGRARSLCSLI